MQKFTIEPLAHHEQSYQNTIFIKILDQFISLPNLHKIITTVVHITVPMQNKLKEMRKWPEGRMKLYIFTLVICIQTSEQNLNFELYFRP
jgi:hypothetical protein